MARLLNANGLPLRADADARGAYTFGMLCLTCTAPVHPVPLFELTLYEADALMAMQHDQGGAVASIPARWSCRCLGGRPLSGIALALVKVEIPACRRCRASGALVGGRALLAGESCVSCRRPCVPACASCAHALEALERDGADSGIAWELGKPCGVTGSLRSFACERYDDGRAS